MLSVLCPNKDALPNGDIDWKVRDFTNFHFSTVISYCLVDTIIVTTYL